MAELAFAYPPLTHSESPQHIIADVGRSTAQPDDPSIGLPEIDLGMDQKSVLQSVRRETSDVKRSGALDSPTFHLSRLSAVEYKGHRSVVQQLNLHVGGKDSSFHVSTVLS